MAAAPPLALRTRALARRYRVGLGLRQRTALAGVDLELEPGRSLGLVGPNGSGKSTLLRLVAGAERPSRGSLEVFGEDPRTSRGRRALSWLPADAPFPLELDARRNLSLLGAVRGLDRARVEEEGARLLARVGLADHAHAPLRTYSSGMLRRFGLAQAFLGAPRLVLLDEPTAGLDAEGFDALADLLDDARARGTTLVLASHLVEDVLRHTDHLAVLLDGRVRLAGPPEALLRSDADDADDAAARWTVEGLDAEGRARLADWVREHGGRLRPGTGTRRSLLDLYRAAREAPGSPDSPGAAHAGEGTGDGR